MQKLLDRWTNLLVLFSTLFLCSCASVLDPRYFTEEKRLELGSYVNGRNSIQGSNYAFVAAEDAAILLVEFDSKPFFVEGNVKHNNRLVSPLHLSNYAPDLVIPTGPHSITVRYEQVAPDGVLGAALGIDKVTARIDTETKLEFIAEQGHTYMLKSSVAPDPNSRYKSWRPVVADVPPKQKSK